MLLASFRTTSSTSNHRSSLPTGANDMRLIFANDLIDLKILSQWHAAKKVISGVTELQNVGGITRKK